MLLKDKKVVIIGGSSGIGEATTKLLSENGAKLFITSRSQDKLDRVKKENKGVIKTGCFNFTDEKTVKDFFNGIEDIDHLVIVAAGFPHGAYLSDENFIGKMKNYFNQKFWGVVNIAKYGIPKVKKKGSIIFFIGGAGKNAYPGVSPVASVNCAIVGLAKTIAVEVAPKRVNVLCPGLIDTHVYDSIPEKKRKSMYENAAKKNPVGRMGKPEDIAKGVLFLLTNDFVNGTVLDITGGDHIHHM